MIKIFVKVTSVNDKNICKSHMMNKKLYSNPDEIARTKKKKKKTVSQRVRPRLSLKGKARK